MLFSQTTVVIFNASFVLTINWEGPETEIIFYSFKFAG